MEDEYEWDQPISRLIKGFRNYNIKWGSKDFNEDVLTYNSTRNFKDGDIKKMNLINDLCNNTVVASMAISALLNFIFMDYERAVETDDEELKYVCWIRYHKTMTLAEEMNLGSGTFGKTHATFDNISNYTAKAIHNMFLFKYNKNLTSHDFDLLETVYDTFNIPKERKEEIKKICGDPFEVQIDLSEDYYEQYKRK